MYKEIVKSKGQKLTILLPDDLVGKTIEIIAFEVSDKPAIPRGKFKSKDDFLEMCGILKGSDITLEKIREKAWKKHSL